MLNCSMIRLAVAALCAGLSGVALAQVQAPTVTLYGVADGGVTHITGLASGKNAVVSGIMDGSRFGLKGEEPLGGGYRAMFTLENRVELDTGALGNRTQSGSQTPDRFSQVALLNQAAGAAALPTSGPAAPFVANAVSGVATAIGSTIGVNLDSRSFDRQAWVGLVTPVGGFLLGRQYTPAYEAGATFDIMGTSSALSAAQVATLPAAVQAAFTNALKQDARLYHLGYKLSKGAHTVYTAYNVYDDRRPANADVRSYGMVYSYALSKRTDLSGQVVRFVNGDLAQAAPGQVGYLGGVTRSAGTDSTVVAAGIRHRF